MSKVSSLGKETRVKDVACVGCAVEARRNADGSDEKMGKWEMERGKGARVLEYSSDVTDNCETRLPAGKCTKMKAILPLTLLIRIIRIIRICISCTRTESESIVASSSWRFSGSMMSCRIKHPPSFPRSQPAEPHRHSSPDHQPTPADHQTSNCFAPNLEDGFLSA